MKATILTLVIYMYIKSIFFLFGYHSRTLNIYTQHMSLPPLPYNMSRRLFSLGELASVSLSSVISFSEPFSDLAIIPHKTTGLEIYPIFNIHTIMCFQNHIFNASVFTLMKSKNVDSYNLLNP